MEKQEIQMTELVCGLSSALELVSQSLVEHHRLVFGFAIKIAALFPVSDEVKLDIGIAALLHDIGTVALQYGKHPELDDTIINNHADFGYHLIGGFAPFAAVAEMVRLHHSCWNRVQESDASYAVKLGGSILKLADCVAQRMDGGRCALDQSAEIRRWIVGTTPGVFMPEVVDAFLHESAKEYFWFDARYASVHQLGQLSPLAVSNLVLDLDELKEMSSLFSKIVDYRSRHTATHSRSVAHTAAALARLLEFDSSDCTRIHVAGNLHDIGKLAVPPSILDKPGPLTPQERNLVKSHAYHTYRILREMASLGEIPAWASFHHECDDGSGYPFRLCGSQIPPGAKIVAAADTFAALTEHRTYREGLPRRDCLRIMHEHARDRKLAPELVRLVERNYDHFYDLTLSAQKEGLEEYESILQQSLPVASGRRLALVGRWQGRSDF